MKGSMRLWGISGLAALLALGSVCAVRADDSDKPSGDDGQPTGMKGHMDGDDMGAGRMNKLKERLGLSEDQAAKIKGLFKKQREDMKPLRDQAKIDMDTLQQKVDTKASDADVKKLLDALSSDRKKMEEGRQKLEDQLRAILSPTQQAKFVLGMKERGRQMMGKWMKNRMGKKDKADQDPKAADGDQSSSDKK